MSFQKWHLSCLPHETPKVKPLPTKFLSPPVHGFSPQQGFFHLCSSSRSFFQTFRFDLVSAPGFWCPKKSSPPHLLRMEQLQETIVPFAGRAWRSPAGKKATDTHGCGFCFPEIPWIFARNIIFIMAPQELTSFIPRKILALSYLWRFLEETANQKKNPKMVVVEVVRDSEDPNDGDFFQEFGRLAK